MHAASATVPVLVTERPGLRPALLLSCLLAVLVIGLTATGRAGMLNWLYPVAAVVIAIVLHARRPWTYIGFAWWMFLVSAGVRRLADYQAGWREESLISITPLLVGLVVAPSLLRRLPKLLGPGYAAYVLLGAGVLYGYMVGLVRAGPAAATYAMLTWLVPLMLGAHIALSGELYRDHRRVIGRTYTWALIATGIYGILQFIDPQPWDRYWMVQSGMESIGSPEPFRVRVFSFVNAPGPFGYVAAGHLLLVLGHRGRGRPLALVLGTAGLLLSLVRAAWLGLACGLLVYVAWLPGRIGGRRVLRALATAAAAVLLVAGLLRMLPVEPMRERLSARIATFDDPSADDSFQARSALLGEYLAEIRGNFTGHGLGTTGQSLELSQTTSGVKDFDNGLLEILYTLGWPGGLLFIAGLLGLVLPALRRSANEDAFIRAARAGGICMLVQAAFGNVFVNNTGAALYTAFGLLTADRLWKER